jgi:prepilin-type N-terminal cleavage/methylation domain-containing protein
MRDEGFTLIELLVVIIIIPIVVSGISIAIITSLKDDTAVPTRLADSHDAQITSAYFVRDVQSATELWAPTGLSTPLCGTGNQLLGLEWNLAVGTPTYVSYVTKLLGTSPALVRNVCSGTTVSASTVAHDLASLTAAVVSLTCSRSDPTNCASDAAAAPVTSLDVELVQVTVSEQSGYQYMLTAAPRPFGSQGTNATPPGASLPTLLLLGSGQNVLNCAGSGTGQLTVNGMAAVDSTATGSLNFAGGDKIAGGQVYSGNGAGGSSGPLQPPSAYTATSTVPYQPGPPIPDPYASLADPSTTGLPVYHGSFTGNTTLPGPGVYMDAVSVTKSQTLASGIYIFEQGFSASGSPGSTINGSAGVLFFIGVPNAPPGTPQPAIFSDTGNNAVQLAPMTAGPYSGMVIFQARTDTNALNIAGNGSTFSGAIYAAGASVNTSGNGATAAAGIVANSLTCGGNGGVTLGSKVPTSVALSSAPPNPTAGQTITFTAAVTASDGLTPAGTITFAEKPNGSSTPVTMCTTAVPTNGQATCSTSTLVPGGSPYTITVSYGGNVTFLGSTSPPMSQTVGTPTSTTVTATPATPTTGQSLVLTATIAPTPDSGTVTWSIIYGASGNLPCSITTPLTTGTATCTINAAVLQASTSPYVVKASYGGDSLFGPSTGTLNLSVGLGPSTTTASTSTSITLGSTITDTTTVGGSGPTATGSVKLYICSSTTTGCTSTTGTLLETDTLAAGQLTSAPYTPLAAGSYCFAAYYLGDPNYSGSSDVTADQCFTVA